METVLEERPEEVRPADSPTVPTPELSPQPEQSLDDALAEFERTSQAEPEPAADNALATQAQNDELDQLIAELSGPTADQQRIGELERQLQSIRQQEIDRQEVQAFEGFAKQLQQQCGVNAPDDFARTQLLSMAMERPELQVAWKYRDVTPQQRQAAEREYRALDVQYRQTQLAPNGPEKAQALAQMEQRGQELAFMVNAHAMLNKAWNEVRTKARKLAPVFDAESMQATADRAAVAQAVREGRGEVNYTDPPIQWGRLTDNEFRNMTREKFGF